jgi:serine/threonine protein kinase
MIAFACPECGQKLKVKDELGGKRGKCPKCEKPLNVPATGPDGRDGPTLLPASGSANVEAPTLAPAPPSNFGSVGSLANVVEEPARDRELTEFLAAAQGPGELGRLGTYRVLQILGHGGMGVVFRAEDPVLKRAVALKAMLPRLAASGTAAQRFLREAQAIAAVKHDHIVTIYQVGEERGVPFLAMEFLDGEPLDVRLKRERRLPAAEVVRIGRETAEGLEAAHERGLIHRDIKPANLWLEGKKARVKILDFGLARSGESGQQLTQQGAILGTPAYMAPEQSGGPTDARSDLFSLGVVLYLLSTGELPFKGNDTVSTLIAVATHEPPPPKEICPGLSPTLSRLVMDLLAKQPGDRPQTARTLPPPWRPLAGRNLGRKPLKIPSPKRNRPCGKNPKRNVRPSPALPSNGPWWPRGLSHSYCSLGAGSSS